MNRTQTRNGREIASTRMAFSKRMLIWI